jgi:hypothetical protein
MQDYQDFPPIKSFIRVLKTCPRSALLYVQMWKKRNAWLKLDVPREDIRPDYLISPTLFINLLCPLISLSLVFLREEDDGFHISFSRAHLDE